MTATRVPWWLSIPATFIPTHAAPVTAGPVLSRDDPGDVETFKQLACWLARRAPHCDLEDGDDFGHPAMAADEVLAAWTLRRTTRGFGIEVSERELATVLAWFKEHGCGEVIPDGDEHWPNQEPYCARVPFCPTCCDAAGFCEDPYQ